MEKTEMIRLAANIWLLGLSVFFLCSQRKIQKAVGVFGLTLLTINISSHLYNILA